MKQFQRQRRRGSVIAQVAVMTTAMIGMAALAIDIGSMYVVKAELQAVADASALAAASQLVAFDEDNPTQLARDEAQSYAQKNPANGVFASLDVANDVEFGNAQYDSVTERFQFAPGATPTDSVKVTARRDNGQGGSVGMNFAKIFGMSSRDMEASAVATLIPRDIVVVIDLSRSMLFDSQLRYYNRTDGGYTNLRDVWAALDGPEPSRPYWPDHETATEYAGDSGPAFGYMTEWGTPLDTSYRANTDPGLFYIPRTNKVSGVADSRLTSQLAARGYNAAEISALTYGYEDSNESSYERRVAVLLGLAEWHSGKSGGKFEGDGIGDGDNRLESSEVKNWVSVDSATIGDMSWTSWIDWVHRVGGTKSNTFKYRYGLKNLTDYLMEYRAKFSMTPSLAFTPEQPTRAVKDAVQELADYLIDLQSPDQLSLAIYGQTTSLEVQLTDSLNTIPQRLYEMSAGHYNYNTNIGGGIAIARTELESARARGAARKVIILMSDGVANIDEGGSYNVAAAKAYAEDQSEYAGQDGITIHTVSVGYGVDRTMMQTIATNGNGLEFYAAGSPDEYTAELKRIFRSLGGKRPVVLIE